ncbi:MFS transporter [Corynebacterium guangdongense]|uniref:MFS family permease n=1 Tax=Corynebacterium guangdongense TaxID=1783348 RepID=A0ABU2A2H2_9CORY|nr:MFS transporter [Corynebacterium guangdongense]MDR7330687.1 MFS family permease [Corynebacterium guangdongense]WJZ16702.1 Proline/betaine transporter [Corynebacterium guangdongense]
MTTTQTSAVTTPAAAPAPESPSLGSRRSPKKAALASFLGSTLEYYDFFIYGTAAALVFPALFFPEGNQVIATVGAFASFGVAYITRPLGGLVMGHFGDRVGRKRVLMYTLLIMGVASLAIGLLPTYGSIGVTATILLVIARLAQGFSAGAEAAGASSLTIEHSPEGRRGFFTSFVMSGYAAGMVLSTVVFIPISRLPEQALMTWGWRIPFLLSVVVLGVAFYVRTRLDETPVFEDQVEATGGKTTLPAADVLRYQGGDVLRVILMSAFSVMQTIFTVLGLSYATSTAGFERSDILTVNAVTIGLSMLVMPLAAATSDRIGRRPVLLMAMTGCALVLPCYFLALGSGNIWLVFAASLLLMTFLYSGFNGLWPSFFGELFASPVRYTGMAMGNQLGLVVAGFGPMIGAVLLTDGHYGWIPVAVFAAVVSLLAGLAVFFSRETAHTPITELGRPYLEAVAAAPAPARA